MPDSSRKACKSSAEANLAPKLGNDDFADDETSGGIPGIQEGF